MKRLLIITPLLFLLSCSESSSSTVNVDEKEVSIIKIDNLEVMTEDLGKMTWDEAKKACKNLGDGWHLPTKDELNLLYENKEKIGGFKSFYWSSTEDDSNLAWFQNFINGYQYNDGELDVNHVRAVRSIE